MKIFLNYLKLIPPLQNRLTLSNDESEEEEKSTGVKSDDPVQYVSKRNG